MPSHLAIDPFAHLISESGLVTSLPRGRGDDKGERKLRSLALDVDANDGRVADGRVLEEKGFELSWSDLEALVLVLETRCELLRCMT